MTAEFRKHGLNFLYPENWEVQESYSEDTALEIYLVAPSGAFWSVLVYPLETDPQALMKSVLESLNEQYQSLESHPVEETCVDRLLYGFDSHFFCLDLLVTNRMRTVTGQESRILLVCQAESREFEKLEPVFLAITTSLLNGLQEPEIDDPAP